MAHCGFTIDQLIQLNLIDKETQKCKVFLGENSRCDKLLFQHISPAPSSVLTAVATSVPSPGLPKTSPMEPGAWERVIEALETAPVPVPAPALPEKEKEKETETAKEKEEKVSEVDPFDFWVSSKPAIVTTLEQKEGKEKHSREEEKEKYKEKEQEQVKEQEKKILVEIQPQIIPSLVPSKDFPHFFSVFDDALSQELCEKLVRYGTDALETESESVTSYREKYLQGSLILFKHDFSGQKFRAELNSALKTIWNCYKQDWASRCPGTSAYWGRVRRIEAACLWRYGAEEKDFHTEYSDHWCAEYALREYSVILYLSDVDKGGEIVFPDYNLKISPKAGRAIVFPSHSSYVHVSLPSQSQDKWEVTSWYCLDVENGVLPKESLAVL